MRTSDPPVLYFTRYVPSYRVAVFDRLNRRLGGRLVVCAGRAGGADLRSIEARSSPYRTVTLPDFWFKGEAIHGQAFWKALGQYPRISAMLAEESPRTVTLPLLMAYAKLRGIPFGLWGHFSSNTRPMGSTSVLDRYRLFLASRANVCVTYTEQQAAALAALLPHDRVVAARNTLDTETLFEQYDRLSSEGKTNVRLWLGINPQALTIVYIGRLIAEKGVDLLLDVLQRVQAHKAAQLVVVGAGSRRERLEKRIAEEHIPGVHFYGAITDLADSAPHIFAADVMLIPGYLGLQVNHAFALGVPIVSRMPPGPGRYHSPEVDFVENGRNGLLVDSPDPDTLARAVLTVASDNTFGRNALAFAHSNLNIEQMVDGLEKSVRFMEQSDLRTTLVV